MDPNANLAEQLEIARSMVDCGELAEGDSYGDEPLRLAELVIALNDWIVNGGFLPAKWEAKK